MARPSSRYLTSRSVSPQTKASARSANPRGYNLCRPQRQRADLQGLKARFADAQQRRCDSIGLTLPLSQSAGRRQASSATDRRRAHPRRRRQARQEMHRKEMPAVYRPAPVAANVATVPEHAENRRDRAAPCTVGVQILDHAALPYSSLRPAMRNCGTCPIAPATRRGPRGASEKTTAGVAGCQQAGGRSALSRRISAGAGQGLLSQHRAAVNGAGTIPPRSPIWGTKGSRVEYK